MDSYRVLIFSLYSINIIFAIILIFFERRNPTSTWAWLLILFFIPIIGFFMYLLFAQDMRKKKLFDGFVDCKLFLDISIQCASIIRMILQKRHCKGDV